MSFKSKTIPQGIKRGKGIWFKKHKPTNWFSSLEERRRHRPLKHLLPEPTRAQAQKQQQQWHGTASRRQLHDEYFAGASATGWSRLLTTWLWRAEQTRPGGGEAWIRVGGARERLGRGLGRSLGQLSRSQQPGRPLQIGPSGIPAAAPRVFLFVPLRLFPFSGQAERKRRLMHWFDLDCTTGLRRYREITRGPFFQPRPSPFPNKRPGLSNGCICPKSD